jgi:16S rRNA (guanine966-N2)-methyltransferase
MPPTSKRRKPTSIVKRPKNTKTSRGLVRIIAGQHRGRRIPVLVHEGLRPTGDRVKETLFNWLMSEIGQANCLDMYAGSGSLGIEALSRGANYTVFIENDKKVAAQLVDNLSTLRETENALVLNTSALRNDLHLHLPESTIFDIVFIDPPFGKDMLENSMTMLVENNLLSSNAYVYVETGHNDKYEMSTQFTLIKQIKTSQVNACLYQRSEIL